MFVEKNEVGFTYLLERTPERLAIQQYHVQHKRQNNNWALCIRLYFFCNFAQQVYVLQLHNIK